MPPTHHPADHPRRARSRAGLSSGSVLLLLALLVLLAFAVWFFTQRRVSSDSAVRPAPGPPGTVQPRQALPRGSTPANAPSPSSREAAAVPVLRSKPRPVNVPFQFCPPEGDGGDPTLNRLKNRVDSTAWLPVSVDAVLALSWPRRTENTRHATWSAPDAAQIARYEGTPIRVEGYLNGARESGPEACNCHGADHAWRDWHVWLSAAPGPDRTRSVVVETTPAIRARHPEWTLARLRAIAAAGRKVRVSGWLMFDPEHPDQIGKTRGTIWEVHPILAIEVDDGGRWLPLGQETIAPRPRTRRTRRSTSTP